MELGCPQLYAEANRVARDVDLTYLEELGPFLKALSVITADIEQRKNKSDKITIGYDLGEVEQNIGGSFLLWRGALMKDEWIT